MQWTILHILRQKNFIIIIFMKEIVIIISSSSSKSSGSIQQRGFYLQFILL